MAGALVKRDLHLLLFSMIYDWRERSLEMEEEREKRDTSAAPSSPGQYEVENERDCEWGIYNVVAAHGWFLNFQSMQWNPSHP